MSPGVHARISGGLIPKFRRFEYYPRMANVLSDLITDFAGKLTAMIHSQVMEDARARVNAALGMEAPKRRGRPPKALGGVSIAKKIRRKLPPQFCPVPGCKNKAAPVFGMVCAKHKDVAKSKIKKYRDARKAKKLRSAA
jgi:hypothetical protein